LFFKIVQSTWVICYITNLTCIKDVYGRHLLRPLLTIIENEIVNLLKMLIIEEVEHSDVQYLSPIFTVPKKDGEYRMILNLKDLNLNITEKMFPSI
jgi:adenylyl- and sulfurtransferase ThiI